MIFLFLFLPLLIFGYYDPIDSVLEKFSRKTTIVQLGSSTSDEVTKFIKNHQSSQVIIFEDNNPQCNSKHNHLLESFSKKSFSQVPILLHKRLYREELKELSKSEFFDITLILGKSYYTNSIKDFGKQYVEDLLKLSIHTFIECAYDSKQAHFLYSHKPDQVQELENGNFLFYFMRNRETLSKVHLISKKYVRNIASSYDENIEIVNPGQHANIRALSRPLGLNVVNFKLFYGSFPLSKTLRNVATPKQFIGIKKYTHPHEVYINNNSYEIAASRVPKKGERVLTKDILDSFFKASSQKLVKDLL